MPTRLESEELAQLIEDKHGILTQLHALARRQQQLICSGDIAHLLALLAAKQQLLVQLQRLERQLDPFRQQDPEQRSWESPAARQRCAQAAADCQRLLEEVIVLERQSETDLVRRRDSAATALRGAHGAAEARHAYLQQTSAPSAAHLDLTSDSHGA